MHPRQASLITHASAVEKQTSGGQTKEAATAYLWKYDDPDGGTFYLEERKTTVKSPFTGKSFTAHPTKHTPSQVAKMMGDDGGEAKTAAEESSWAPESTEKIASESDPWKVRETNG